MMEKDSPERYSYLGLALSRNIWTIAKEGRKKTLKADRHADGGGSSGGD